MNFTSKDKLGAFGWFVFIVFIIYSSLITYSIRDNYGAIVSANFNRIFETYKFDFLILFIILLVQLFVIIKYYKLDIKEGESINTPHKNKLEIINEYDLKKSEDSFTYLKGINILLPHKLDESFSDILKHMGYNTIWSHNQAILNEMIYKCEIHLAFEWQWGENDHTIRDTLMKYNKKTPVILCLNWNNHLPENFNQLGYTDYIEVPFKIERINYLVRKYVKT